MVTGVPAGNSIFTQRTVEDIYDEIRGAYSKYPQPWVIGYSGGKDSTAVLQLVWKALEALPPEQRQKPVYVIASDTKVETPVIVDYIDATLRRVNEKAAETGMPFRAEKVMPTLNDSFFVNLIGRGYPAPTTRFRWCTERLKINPANRFIAEKVRQNGEVVMVLGVRAQESTTRAQLMSTYQVKGHLFRRHSSLPGAWVYAPVAEFSTDDVWTYLLQVPSPWGNNNRDLAALYRSASSGECPLVIDTSTPSCGNSRFGCWVCTVANRDSSMEAMVDNGEEWLEPLLDFRDWLSGTVDPKKKHQYRDTKGRDGRKIYMGDGKLAARTYKMEASREMLRRVLQAQADARRGVGPESDIELISEEELHEIRRLWRTERQDWEDSVPQIYRQVSGSDLPWLTDDDGKFDAQDQQLLEAACREHDVPFEMVAKLLGAEKRSQGMARRAEIQKDLNKVLAEEWRSDKEFVVGEMNRTA